MNSRYIKKSRVGHGLCSDIYLAEDTETQSQVALKVTEPMDDRAPHNSRIELQLLKLLQHTSTSVVPLLDSFEVLDELVMVMPFYRYTLRDLMESNCRKRVDFNAMGGAAGGSAGSATAMVKINKFPPSRLDMIVSQLVSLLKFVHSKGIIHRDLKPENILFSDLTSDQPVVADFGICWIAPDNHGKEPPVQKLVDIATGVYKLPELIFGVTSYTKLVDIWSLGVIMTELYSRDGVSVLYGAGPVDPDYDMSDIVLLSNILDTFGTEQLPNWSEVHGTSSFQLLQFQDRKLKTSAEIVPRCSGDMVLTFEKMMRYESGERQW